MAQMQELVRIAGSDLDGSKNVLVGLRKIKGVNYVMANALCNLLSIDKNSRLKGLGDEGIKKVEQFLENPKAFGVPEWLLNRRKDPETSEDIHLINIDLKLAKEEDLKVLKKIKSYKGLRHQKGLTVRGQRTKSNHRRNKGKAAKGKSKK